MSKRFYIPAGMRKEEDFLMWDIQVGTLVRDLRG